MQKIILFEKLQELGCEIVERSDSYSKNSKYRRVIEL